MVGLGAFEGVYALCFTPVAIGSGSWVSDKEFQAGAFLALLR